MILLLIIAAVILISTKLLLFKPYYQQLPRHYKNLYLKYSSQYPNSYWEMYKKWRLTRRQKKWLKLSLISFHHRILTLGEDEPVKYWLDNELINFNKINECNVD